MGVTILCAFKLLTRYSINMGRAPARRVFNDALEVLVANSDKVREFVTHKLPISDAAKGFEIFEKQMARKVVLVF